MRYRAVLRAVSCRSDSTVIISPRNAATGKTFVGSDHSATTGLIRDKWVHFFWRLFTAWTPTSRGYSLVRAATPKIPRSLVAKPVIQGCAPPVVVKFWVKPYLACLTLACLASLTLQLTRAPLGGGGYFEPPSRFLAISSKPLKVSPPNLQYPLSQHFYTLC